MSNNVTRTTRTAVVTCAFFFLFAAPFAATLNWKQFSGYFVITTAQFLGGLLLVARRKSQRKRITECSGKLIFASQQKASDKTSWIADVSMIGIVLFAMAAMTNIWLFKPMPRDVRQGLTLLLFHPMLLLLLQAKAIDLAIRAYLSLSSQLNFPVFEIYENGFVSDLFHLRHLTDIVAVKPKPYTVDAISITLGDCSNNPQVQRSIKVPHLDRDTICKILSQQVASRGLNEDDYKNLNGAAA